MDEGVYRTKETVAEPKSEPEKKGDGSATQDVKVEPPYLDYEKEYHHPYLVDHFKLGDTWKDKLGGFEKEVDAIEGYFREEIEQGRIKNEIGAVRDQLKKIFRLCNIENTERTTMQIEKLSAYIDFLNKTKNISLNHYKYGR